MTESSVNDSILNIKTFYGYLEHIISSVERNEFHEPTVTKISDMITKYYNEINEDDEEDSLPNITIFDSSDNETKYESNSDSDSDSDTSDEEDENSQETKASVNSMTKSMIKKDEYLLNFIDSNFDNSTVELYKNPYFESRLKDFVSDYSQY